MFVSLFLTTLCLFLILLIYFYMDINDEKSCDQQQGKTPANSVTGCTVKYNDMSREVILNNAIVVACFRSSSFNCLFFEYLHLNQSRELSYKELEQRLFSGRIIQLNKMPDQMGFRGELKKALFTVTKNTIIYHPCKLDQYKKIRI